jgi:hemerythrin superfamily protein
MSSDVVDLLLEQHARIEQLFHDVLTTTGEERQERWEELVRLLAVHETAEEEVVHPIARQSIDDGDEIVDARLAEEHRAKEMLSELYDLGPDAPDFETRLLQLRQAVLTHARYEERYEFTRLRAARGDGSLQALVAAVRAAEATAPTRPHPGVETVKKNLLAGPPLAIMDRVRDLIREAQKSAS